jgi:hypothetical protein
VNRLESFGHLQLELVKNFLLLFIELADTPQEDLSAFDRW